MSYGVISSDELYTKQEVADRLGMSLRTLDRRLTELQIMPWNGLIPGSMVIRAATRLAIEASESRRTSEDGS